VDGVGVIGVVVGLWLALPQRAGARDTSAVVLAWILVSLSALLILTSTLALPSSTSGSDVTTNTTSTPTYSRHGAPVYSLPSGLGNSAYTPVGSDALSR
jgi:hypothetical protein